MRKLWVMMLLLMVAVVAAACGGGDDDSGDDGDNGDDVEEVSLDSAETFSATGYTISVPDGWVAEEDDTGQFTMYSSADLAEQDAQESLTDDDGGFIIFAIPSTAIVPEDGDITDVLSAGGAIGLVPSDAEVASAESITIDGRDAARTELLNAEGVDTIFYAVESDTTLYVLAGVANAGNLNAFESTFDAIAQSFAITGEE